MKETKTSSHLLVAAGKSSRLDAIRKKAGLADSVADLNKKQTTQPYIAGLNKQTTEVLQQAVSLIEGKLASIMNSYPAGKQKTFFKFKYGIGVDELKGLVILDIFKLLELDNKTIQYFYLIDALYLNGERAND